MAKDNITIKFSTTCNHEAEATMVNIGGDHWVGNSDFDFCSECGAVLKDQDHTAAVAQVSRALYGDGEAMEIVQS